jgi:hypothetical protein
LTEWFYPGRNFTLKSLETLGEKDTGIIFPPVRFDSIPIQNFLDWLIKQPQIKPLLQEEHNNHYFAKYADHIDFFKELRVNLTKYGNLSDSYQWFLYSVLDGKSDKSLKKSLYTLVIEEKTNFDNLLQEFRKYVGTNRRDFAITTNFSTKLGITAKVGDYILTITQKLESLYAMVDKLKIEISIDDFEIDLTEFADFYNEIPDKTIIYPIYPIFEIS